MSPLLEDGRAVREFGSRLLRSFHQAQNRSASQIQFTVTTSGQESLPLIFRRLPTRVRTISLERDDEALVHLSQEGLLSLSLAEMHAIQAYFRAAQRQQRRQAYGLGAEPTDVELEALAQTWSEHFDILPALKGEDSCRP